MTTYYKAWILVDDKGNQVLSKRVKPIMFFTRKNATMYSRLCERKFKVKRAEVSVHWDHFQKA